MEGASSEDNKYQLEKKAIIWIWPSSPNNRHKVDDHILIKKNILVLIQMIPGYKKKKERKRNKVSKLDLINNP